MARVRSCVKYRKLTICQQSHHFRGDVYAAHEVAAAFSPNVWAIENRCCRGARVARVCKRRR